MSVEVRVKCNGPRCKRSAAVTYHASTRRGLEIAPPPYWITDSTIDLHWCSNQCHAKWRVERDRRYAQ